MAGRQRCVAAARYGRTARAVALESLPVDETVFESPPSFMNIAIIGSGNLGSVLGRRLARLGHQVCFASRDPANDRIAAVTAEFPDHCSSVLLGPGAIDAECTFYAAPYEQVGHILPLVGDLQGAVLVDCSNPLNPTFDGLRLGHTDSAGERIARLAPTARVVKAFNTTSVATLEDPKYNGDIATQFYCGDDEEAKRLVAKLISQLEMEPVDAGPLRNARYLEATAMLYIHLAIRGGWGGNCALKILKR